MNTNNMSNVLIEWWYHSAFILLYIADIESVWLFSLFYRVCAHFNINSIFFYCLVYITYCIQLKFKWRNLKKYAHTKWVPNKNKKKATTTDIEEQMTLINTLLWGKSLHTGVLAPKQTSHTHTHKHQKNQKQNVYNKSCIEKTTCTASKVLWEDMRELKITKTKTHISQQTGSIRNRVCIHFFFHLYWWSFNVCKR